MTLATKKEAQAVQVVIPKDASLYGTILATVQRVPKLRVMNPDVIRDITDAVVAALGHADKPSIRIPGDPVPFCGPDAELLGAIQKLLEWRPEGGYSPHFGEFAVKDDDSRFYFLEGESDDPAEQAVEYQNAVSRGADVDEETGKRRHWEAPPFLSQVITYPVLGGKHDGRGFMNRVNDLRVIAGLPEEDA